MRAFVSPAVLLATAAVPLLAGCAGQPAGDTGTPPPTETATATVTATETVTERATATVTASPSASPTSRDCGQVAFEPGTDAGAFDIQARGVRCRVAHRVARAAEGHGGEAYDAAAGFHCRPTGTVGQLPSVVYRCAGDSGGRVTFHAS